MLVFHVVHRVLVSQSTSRFSQILGCLAILLLMVTAVHSSGHAAGVDKTAVKLMVFGDSLTAGYGLPKTEAFTEKLSIALRQKGIKVVIIAASVSGDTTAGGKARLAWSLSEKPDALLLELGANDGLRGIEPDSSRANLQNILMQLKKKETPVLLAGMLAPPNLGKEYGIEFNRIFPELAKQFQVLYYPFFLEGVAAIPKLNQADGIHPNAKGVDEIVKRILPSVIELIQQVQKSAQKPAGQ